MRRYIRYLYAISLVVSSLLLASCGQDRSGILCVDWCKDVDV